MRLHLHEPRAARAEQDVHNVRAGRYTVSCHDLDLLKVLSTNLPWLFGFAVASLEEDV